MKKSLQKAFGLRAKRGAGSLPSINTQLGATEGDTYGSPLSESRKTLSWSTPREPGPEVSAERNVTISALSEDFVATTQNILSKLETGLGMQDDKAFVITELEKAYSIACELAEYASLYWDDILLSPMSELMSLVRLFDPKTPAALGSSRESQADAQMSHITVLLAITEKVKSLEQVFMQEVANLLRSPSSSGAHALKDTELQADVEEWFLSHDDGVSAAFGLTKTWSRFTKEVGTYLDKRAAIMQECHKRLLALSTSCLDTLQGDSNVPCHGPVTSMLRVHAAESTRVLENLTGPAHSLILSSLTEFRARQDKARKQLKDQWQRDTKRLTDAQSNLSKLEAKFQSVCGEWERALTARCKEEQSTYKLKLEKRAKEEQDIKSKLGDARTGYVNAIKAHNDALSDLYQSREALLSTTSVLLFGGGQTVRDMLLNFHESVNTNIHEHEADIHNQLSELDAFRSGPDVYRFVTDDTGTPRDSFPLPSRARFQPYALPHSVTDYLHDIQEENMCEASVEVPLATAAHQQETSDGGGRSKVLSAAEVAAQPDMHSFIRLNIPSKCRVCRKACYFHAVICSKCSLTCHKDCTDQLSDPCGDEVSTPRHKSTLDLNSHRVFASPLSSQAEETVDSVPIIVRRIADVIERNGIDYEGIYRLSGIKSEVEALCTEFEKNPRGVEIEDCDPATLAAVLKLYLRQLPESVIPADHFDDFLQIGQFRIANKADPTAPQQAAQQLRVKTKELDPINYNTLAFLCGHLHRVSLNADVNKMRASNLGIVFGPTLLRNESETLAALVNMPIQTVVVEIMIQFSEEIFSDYFQQRPRQRPSSYKVSCSSPGARRRLSARPSFARSTSLGLTVESSSTTRGARISGDETDTDSDLEGEEVFTPSPTTQALAVVDSGESLSIPTRSFQRELSVDETEMAMLGSTTRRRLAHARAPLKDVPDLDTSNPNSSTLGAIASVPSPQLEEAEFLQEPPPSTPGWSSSHRSSMASSIVSDSSFGDGDGDDGNHGADDHASYTIAPTHVHSDSHNDDGHSVPSTPQLRDTAMFPTLSDDATPTQTPLSPRRSMPPAQKQALLPLWGFASDELESAQTTVPSLPAEPSQQLLSSTSQTPVTAVAGSPVFVPPPAFQSGQSVPDTAETTPSSPQLRRIRSASPEGFGRLLTQSAMSLEAVDAVGDADIEEDADQEALGPHTQTIEAGGADLAVVSMDDDAHEAQGVSAIRGALDLVVMPDTPKHPPLVSSMQEKRNPAMNFTHQTSVDLFGPVPPPPPTDTEMDSDDDSEGDCFV
eukprot:m.257346 g.257346  ORF g.257346 m.257346 type:complete len:1287 (+) comp15527_c1_seq1:111-3971(+)